MNSAAAQGGPGDYKALVCVFLFGGCDSFNLLVPRDSAHYNPYAAARQNLAIPQGQLLPITPNTSDGSLYGLHPSCPELQSLFGAGKLAFVANVGSLFYPMTKAQFDNHSVQRPPQLFSHYDQQFQWMTSLPDSNEGYGWAGRAAELLHSLNGTSALSMNITLQGANTFQVGPTVAIEVADGERAHDAAGVVGGSRAESLRPLAEHDGHRGLRGVADEVRKAVAVQVDELRFCGREARDRRRQREAKLAAVSDPTDPADRPAHRGPPADEVGKPVLIHVHGACEARDVERDGPRELPTGLLEDEGPDALLDQHVRVAVAIEVGNLQTER